MLDVSVAFGRVLFRLRKLKGISQEALAGEADLQRKYISLLEKAEYQPKISTVFRLAEALDLTPAEFVALIDKERKGGRV